MSKITVTKDGVMLEANKITLVGETTVVTGEIIVDEHNRVLEFKQD